MIQKRTPKKNPEDVANRHPAAVEQNYRERCSRSPRPHCRCRLPIALAAAPGSPSLCARRCQFAWSPLLALPQSAWLHQPLLHAVPDIALPPRAGDAKLLSGQLGALSPNPKSNVSSALWHFDTLLFELPPPKGHNKVETWFSWTSICSYRNHTQIPTVYLEIT